MRILTLTLTNFKGIRSFTLETQGGNVNIYADNAVGKTTLFDALTYLLFDKDSQNKKDFEIKTLDANGQPLHGLDHEAEGVFDIDGRKLTLRKSFSEQWTKKRGSATATFTGHTTDYFIDGVPVKKSEYTTKIDSIAKEEIFKLLTSPNYFNEQLHWQKRRELLLQVCGDISDQEVIASDKSLSKLPNIIPEGRTIDKHKSVIKSRQAEINKELERIPVRIDEALRALPDVSRINPGEVSEKITFLKSRLKEKNQEIARIQNGGQVAELTKALREVEGRLLDIQNKHRAEVGCKVQGKMAELHGLRDKIAALQHELKTKNYAIQSNNSSIQSHNKTVTRYREQWYEVNDRQFEYSQECTCPTCGQSLPEEKLAEARENALAAFNLEKAQKLEEIGSVGRQLKTEIERLIDENDSLSGDVKGIKSQLDSLGQTLANLQTEVNSISQEIEDVKTSYDYVQATKQKEALDEQIKTLNGSTSGLIVNARAEITSLEAEIGSLEDELKDVDSYNRGQKRIEELKQQEKSLAAEFERLEQELYLTEQFIRTKVSLLEEKINSRFKMARFKLFDTQVNGGLVETCETLYNGVPYGSGLNNGHRIVVGLDIIRTLSEHYGFAPPIFIDNKESVTKLPEMQAQVISLIVSESDKVLRVEHETSENVMREAV